MFAHLGPPVGHLLSGRQAAVPLNIRVQESGLKCIIHDTPWTDHCLRLARLAKASTKYNR